MVSFCAYDNITMGIHNMVTLPEGVVELFMEKLRFGTYSFLTFNPI